MSITPPSRKSHNFRCLEINRVLDGDTIDVTIDLVSISIRKKSESGGVDTPEKRTI